MGGARRYLQAYTLQQHKSVAVFESTLGTANTGGGEALRSTLVPDGLIAADRSGLARQKIRCAKKLLAGQPRQRSFVARSGVGEVCRLRAEGGRPDRR